MTVGIFLHFDYALGDMLFNENRCYNDIFKHPNIEKVYVFDYKGKYSKMCKDFEFEYTRVLINGMEDVEKFKKVDVMFTWDGYQDFFAGTISPKAVEVYSIISKFTNEYDRKVFFRICDSNHFMKDYKQMIADRNNGTDGGNKFAERNGNIVNSLLDVKRLNYDNVFFLCNGSRSVCDWSWMTLTKSMPFLDAEYVKKNSVYLSDDVLFRYTECYDQMNMLDTDLNPNERINMLYHIGNLNGGKVKKMKEVMKNSTVKLFLRTPERSVNVPLKSVQSIQLVEEPIYRDKMYSELNKYLAYLFVGKGGDRSFYFNKTLYDASIGRTVFLIYGKIDDTRIYNELNDYIFYDAKELVEKFEFIKTNYKEHLKIQRDVLLKNLSKETMTIFETKDVLTS